MRIDVENPMVIDLLWDRNKRAVELESVEDLEEVNCKVCNEPWFLEEIGEGIEESQRWEDQYICSRKECLETHYKGWSETAQNKY
ncbi:hypothetical protein QTG56_24745 (plasmid) [Rossellomorea sp. AcN35-11]|nr:hypothetical protein [Rossellomorea aquimaris]WJV31844.1 hypothetical protein QTG56_24745 [Rossellomorea sp. AcN35-11]